MRKRGGRSCIEGRGQLTPAVEDSGGSLFDDSREQITAAVEDRGEELFVWKSGGIPWALAAMHATRDDIDAALA